MNFKIICTDRDNYEIPYSTKIFAGGEVQVRLLKFPHSTTGKIGDVTIDGLIKSSDIFMEFALIVDALRRDGRFFEITADLHYFPYARQDRVCYAGEAFSASVMWAMLSLIGGVDRYVFDDVHSKVVSDMLANALDKVRHQSELIGDISSLDVSIVSPDKGAREKARTVADDNSLNLIVYDKVRNPDTGKIEKTELLSGEVSDKCLVVDDLMDYGNTFLPISSDLRLRGAEKVYLYVTHLIMPIEPTHLTAAGIDGIFYANKFNDDLDESHKVYHISRICDVINNTGE